MSFARLSSLSVTTLVISSAMFLGWIVAGCSEANTPASSSSSNATGGAGGAGGTGGAGGMEPASSSSSGTGGPFVCDRGNVKETSCKLLEQDCGLGEACRPNAAGTGTNCEQGAGVKGPGADCADTSECSIGQFCVFNHCSPMCCRDNAQPFCGSAPCSVSITFGSSNIWTCNFAKRCNLFTNDCPQTPYLYECHYDPEQQVATCATNSGANAKEGEPCQFVNDCGNDMVCAGSTCRHSCLLAKWMTLTPGTGGCPAAQTCQMQGLSSEVGVCSP